MQIENTTIKTKSNWNPDLFTSISIKRVKSSVYQRGKGSHGHSDDND